MKLATLLTVASRLLLQTRLTQELALGGQLAEIALDLVTADGARLPVMLNATQAPADVDGPGLVRLAVWRAAGRRAYEAEVPKARRVAREAAQAKADFLANISHEIRTPLNGLLGAASLLADDGFDARQQELLQIIQAQGLSLERLISDMLEVSRVQAGALQLEARPFDLLAELGGVIDLARLRAGEKGLDFVVDIAPDLGGEYLGDAVRLKQIVGHLASDALKFTEAGQVRLAVSSDEGRVRIEVADTGIGFDAAEFATLSDRFAQADTGPTRRFGGAGLGLFICKSLVELMGGSISAASERGAGSVFVVDLPLERLPHAAGLPPPGIAPEASPPPDQRLQVLYVEDNPTNQRVVQLILEAFDVDLVLADNGRLGLDSWRARAFDVVLMDIQMPVMDGLTAIREIRQAERERPCGARTPIIVLSANAMEHHRREALAAGADLHLAKPVRPDALVEALHQVLATAAMAAE
ncbi:response regulator [Phenylobacterium sp. J426]|uniref:response regulator n=1 Tax=Phenylobacterium sp. J426 TaxID=2898439 RepID=UPI002150BC4F|nr:response regulator [Phenylobacterium sp. J426]MCR5875462.1 response regulator [Phenylobacterium sp. J426]